MDYDKKIADLQAKIDIELKCRQGAENLRSQLKEANAIQLCKSNIIESQKRLAFLNEQLKKLTIKKYQALGLEVPENALVFAASSNPTFTESAGEIGRLGEDVPPPVPAKDVVSISVSNLDPSLYPASPPSKQLQKKMGAGHDRIANESGSNNHNNTSNSTGSVRMSFYNLYGTLRNRHAHSTENIINNHQSTNSINNQNSHNASSLSVGVQGNNISAYQRNTSGVFSSLFSTLSVRSRSGSITSLNTKSESVSSSAQEPEAIEPVQIHSKVDYWQVGAPISAQKVAYKLKEVSHKLDVEQKVKQGTERMYQTVQLNTEIDKKRIDEVKEKLLECSVKVNLLQRAVQRYKSLYVDDDDDDSNDITAEMKKEGQQEIDTLKNLTASNEFTVTSQETLNVPGKPLKKGVSGKLQVKLFRLSNVTGKKSSKSEVHLIFKVDGVQKYKSKTAKSKLNEGFEITLDHAQDLEVTVHEKSGTILALFWCKLTELRESMSFKTLYASTNNLTVSSNKSNSENKLVESPTELKTNSPTGGSKADLDKIPIVTEGEYLIELEPSGSLSLKFGILPESDKKKAKNDGVIRRKPVKKVFPKKGHKFASLQFYQPMKCAYCNEFLLNGQGYQCQLCRYTCHKRCNSKVLTKCITKVDNDDEATQSKIAEEEEEEKDKGSKQIMNHRIPHRFTPTSNISANWCCHCGFMLPVGKKQSLKCTECTTTCHKECQPLVPDFCGLSPQMIDLMLRAIEDAERLKEEKKRMKMDQLIKKQKSHEELSTLAIQQAENGQQEIIAIDSPPPQGGFFLPSVPQDYQLQQPVMMLSGTLPGQLLPQVAPQQIQQITNAPLQNYQQHVVPQIPTAKDFRQSFIPGMKGTFADAQHKPSANRYIVGHSKAPRGIGLDDFNFLAVLGKGNFGKVMLAEEKYTKEYYAIKVLKKEFIIENDEVESTKSEKRVFLIANRERFPFLVNLHSCFQTESRLYFVMEYVNGGDLMWHIQRQPFSEQRAKFYACEVLLALEHFHKNNIVYRDLKLDNILLTLEGHVKIADYGLCKENMGYGSVTQTFCGTPEFMAPEILLEKPYTRAVDWWAFGVLIYEMILGQSPFKGDDEDEIFEAILEDEIVYPAKMTRDGVSLLQKLLVKDPNKRLGSGKNDAADIKAHPYFKDVDWQAMIECRVPPPFYPTVSSPTDVSNFDEEFTREPPTLTPCTTVLSSSDQEEFRGFTHVSEWAQQARSNVLNAN